jgi:hypothetical protein
MRLYVRRRYLLASYMNLLYVGARRQIEYPKGGWLFICDEAPKKKQTRIFDPLHFSFNPLKGMTYQKARQIADVLYTIYPQGENTLTVRNGRRALLRALLTAEWLDEIQTKDEEVKGVVDDILISPVLRQVFCYPRDQFSFNPRSMIFAKIERTAVGDFDAMVLVLMLLSFYCGQIITDSFYLRPQHISLIREHRLIASCNTLSELPQNLRQAFLQGKVIAQGAIHADAVELAKYQCRFPPNTEGYDAFIEGAMQ